MLRGVNESTNTLLCFMGKPNVNHYGTGLASRIILKQVVNINLHISLYFPIHLIVWIVCIIL